MSDYFFPLPTEMNRMRRMNIRPNYYGGPDSTYEVFKVIDAWGLDFYRGNALKYIARAGKKVSRTGKKKSEIEDLKKAVTYLEQSIAILEKLNSEASNGN